MNKLYKLIFTSVLFCWIFSTNTYGQVYADYTWQGDCSNQNTYFSDISSGDIYAYNWDFGDGYNSALQNPSHMYMTAGTYTVILTVYDASSNPFYKSNSITIMDCSQPLFADFGFYQTCLGDSTIFNDYSTGPNSIVSWYWNFGSGNYATVPSPKFAFPYPGNFPVSLTVTDINSNSQTITKEVNITNCTQQLNAYFNFYGNCKGDTVSFNDNSQGPAPIISWNWNFGDGTSSTAQHPFHIYADTGLYYVVLSVTDDANVTKTHQKDIYINNCSNPPANPANFYWNGTCSNEPTYFYGQLNGANAIAWSWDFGNSTTSNVQNPVIQYNDTGLYHVIMMVTKDNNFTDTVFYDVYINDCTPQLNAYFGYDFTCKGDSTKFFDYSQGPAPVNTWNWNFGDGSTSVEQNPTHVFPDTGLYIVILTVTDTANITKSMQKDLYINSCAPYVDFYWNGNCKNDTVVFSANLSSSYNPTSWNWDFGDGNFSNSSNPMHVYADTGLFSVGMMVTDGNGDTLTANHQIYINDCTPQLNAYFGFDFTCLGDSTKFSDYSQGPAPIISWSWNFGDGTSSTETNPVHVFANAGMYQVVLTVTDTANITKSTQKELYINTCAAYADFYWNGNCKNDTVSFVSSVSSSFGPTSWSWNFSDGSSSVDPNPLHVFADTGFYMVSMVVINANNDSLFMSHDIYISDCSPQLMVYFNFWNTCLGDATQFNDYTQGPSAITSWSWDFGDGLTSSEQNPLHQYVDTGFFMVTLSVTDAVGINKSHSVELHIDNCPPYVDFGWYNNCFGDSTGFSIQTNDSSLNSFNWNFGDGVTSNVMNPLHVFANVGEHSVTLIASNGTKTDTIIRLIYIDSCVQQSYVDIGWWNTCIGDTTHFNVVTNDPTLNAFSWNFGDGNTSSDMNPSNVYASAGNYDVSLIFSNGTKVDTIFRSVYINNCGQPGNVVDFYWNGGCKGDTVHFNPVTADPNNPITSANWSFGDGSFSTMINPAHIYADTGLYQVTLIASNSAGSNDTAYHQVYVSECGGPGNNLNVYFSWNHQCSGVDVGFNDYSNGPNPIISWSWNFDDGSTSNLQNPIHVFADSGVYNVTLTIMDSANISASQTNQVYIQNCGGNGGNDYMEFSWYNTCAGAPTTFVDQTTYQGVGSWVWDFGDGSSDSVQNPTHTYANAGSYNVTLMVFDSTMTNSDTLTKVININSIYVNAGIDVTICQGSNTVLSASGNGTNYYWNTGSNGASTTVNPSATTGYVVFANDSMGCSASDSVVVTVSPKPVVTTTKTNATCGNANGSATAVVTGGVSPYAYTWSNGGTTATISGLSAISYTVSVIDALGCKGNAIANIGNSNGPSVSSISSTPTTCPSFCDGTASVVVSGGTAPYTYTWSSGQNTASITQVCSGTASVTIKDANGCSVVASVVVGSTGMNPNINGMVMIDSLPIANGVINLYGINSSGAFNLMNVLNVINGTYSFSDLSVGNYLMSAIADTNLYPYSIPTYLGYAHSWLGGDTLLTGCDLSITMDLGIIDLTPMTGSGIISGSIVDVTGGVRNSEPLPGVDVSLEEDPNGIIVAHTRTDIYGFYEFANVNEGAYKIFVDIPGLGMVETHSVNVNANDSVSTNNNFFVDSTGTINVVPPTGIKPVVNLASSGAKVYPNPYSGSTNIMFNLTEKNMVVLEVFNLLGKRVAVLENDFKNPGEHKYKFSAKEIGESSGIYIIKLNVNNKIQTQRIIELD